MCRPDEDEDELSLLEKIVNKAQLCANLRLQMESKFKDSLIGMLSNQNSESTQSSLHQDSPSQTKPAMLKRLPKNNSFDEKNSSIKAAMQACLAATEDNEPDNSFFRRGRGMTEGTDEHQINQLNSNTQGMIKQ